MDTLLARLRPHWPWLPAGILIGVAAAFALRPGVPSSPAAPDAVEPGLDAKAAPPVRAAAPPSASAPETSPAASPAEPAAVPVTAATLEAPPAEAPEAPPPSKGVSPALKEAIQKDAWETKLRLSLHDALGTGALAHAGGLTPVGSWVVARVRALDAHAVDPKPYDVPSLDAAVTAAKDEATAATLEAAVGRSLLRLVFDYRLLRHMGPLNLLTEADLDADPALRQKAVKLAVDVAHAEGEAEAMAVLDPPHTSYAPLLAAYARYREAAARGGCPRISAAMRPGDHGDGVQKLQQRLACEGYYAGAIDGAFDEDVRLAVSAYQRHHELEDAGQVLAGTIESLNVPLARRVEQLAIALGRLRESRVREVGAYYLRVNIPAYELAVVENGKIIRRNRVIVGTNKLDDDKVALTQGYINRTKLLVSRLYHVIVNPAWILPERVAKGELADAQDKDPDYLAKKRIGKKTLGDGTEVFVQNGGRGNVLGKVKFLLEKTNAVYLHDTDKPWLFKKSLRAFSHGCMRVHEAVVFAKWLLLRDGRSEKEIDDALAIGTRQIPLPLKKPVPFMTEYVTVDVSDEGLPRFLTDVYGYDKAFEQGNLPPTTTIRWGHSALRPHWVPMVPAKIVDEWRAAGQQAPRDPKWKPPPE